MPAPTIQFGPWIFKTFTAAVAAAVLAASIWVMLRTPRDQRPQTANSLLLGLGLGLAAARLEHVLLNWDYFAAHTEAVTAVARGGLGWHGAALGGAAGIWLGTRIWLPTHPHAFQRTLSALAPVIPLLMLAAWYGCAAAGCGCGREVATLADYPPLVAAELPDIYGVVAPRLNTPLFGMAWAVVLGLLLVALLTRRRREPRPASARPLWGLLALAALGMCAIGGTRADVMPEAGGLRLDQWLDLAAVGAAAAAWAAAGRAERWS
jgi:prolipoprotein diacylglyceryltransferase